MTYPFSYFCRYLEKSGLQHMPLCHWRHSLNDEFDLIEPLLRSTGQKSLLDYQPYAGGPCYKVSHTDGQYTGINENDSSDRILLDENELLYHEFEIERFRRILAEILGFRPCPKGVGLHERFVQIGTWEIGEDKHRIFLLILQNGHENVSLVKTVIAKNKPSVLITPTKANWSEEFMRCVQNKNVFATTLEEVLSIDDGNVWCGGDEWHQAVQHIFQLSFGREKRVRR